MIEFVNCFDVPVGREAEFFQLWQQVNAYMVTRPGYVSHRLLRSLRPDARYRFVNIAQWESAAHLQAGHDDEFRRLVGGPQWAEFHSTPAPYEVVHENAPVAG